MTSTSLIISDCPDAEPGRVHRRNPCKCFTDHRGIAQFTVLMLSARNEIQLLALCFLCSLLLQEAINSRLMIQVVPVL